MSKMNKWFPKHLPKNMGRAQYMFKRIRHEWWKYRRKDKLAAIAVGIRKWAENE